jgi:hypothetical protein
VLEGTLPFPPQYARIFETPLFVNADNLAAQFPQMFAALPQSAIWGQFSGRPETKWTATWVTGTNLG